MDKEILVELTESVSVMFRIQYRGLNSDTFGSYTVYHLGPQQAYEYSLAKLFGESAKKEFFRKWWPKPIYYDSLGPYDEYGRFNWTEPDVSA